MLTRCTGTQVWVAVKAPGIQVALSRRALARPTGVGADGPALGQRRLRGAADPFEEACTNPIDPIRYQKHYL